MRSGSGDNVESRFYFGRNQITLWFSAADGCYSYVTLMKGYFHYGKLDVTNIDLAERKIMKLI